MNNGLFEHPAKIDGDSGAKSSEVSGLSFQREMGAGEPRLISKEPLHSSGNEAAYLLPPVALTTMAGSGLPEELPASRLERGDLLLSSAGSAFLPAVKHAWFGVDDVNVPFSKLLTGHELTIPVPRIAEAAATGAAIGFSAKALLPSTGILGRVGSMAMAIVFTAPLAKQGFDIYRGIDSAKSVSDLRQAGAQLGSAIGNFAATLPVGIASYKLGASGAERLLSTPAMKGFVAAKDNAYSSANDYVATKIDSAANLAKKFIVGEHQYTGSHRVAESYPRISDLQREGIKGEDYQLPTVKLPSGSGDGTNVLVVTGNGVEAPEYTEVVGALRDSGAKVTVAAPDWMFKYQPHNPGKFTLAQWLDNEHTAQADIPVSTAAEMMKSGRFDAVYVPGGAGNTAAIRTDGGVLDLVRQSLNQHLDTWTICHGGQVFISAEALPKGTLLTGSPDIRGQDLPNAGFIVPKDPVVFDPAHKLLSGQDPHVLNQFITALGERLQAIKADKVTAASKKS